MNILFSVIVSTLLISSCEKKTSKVPPRPAKEPEKVEESLPPTAELKVTAANQIMHDSSTTLSIEGGVEPYVFDVQSQYAHFDQANLKITAGSKPEIIKMTVTDASGQKAELSIEVVAVTKLVTGYLHTCALFSHGKVKCWGYNASGQLGIGDALDRGDEPQELGDKLPYVDLGTGRTAKNVYGGGWHNCALLDNDTVKCWGGDPAENFGQLGYGTRDSVGDEPGEMGDALAPLSFPQDEVPIDMALGRYHSCALVQNKTTQQIRAMCWGYAQGGEFATPDPCPNNPANQCALSPQYIKDSAGINDIVGIKKLVAGLYHTCGFLDTGDVMCWGVSSIATGSKATTMAHITGASPNAAESGGFNHQCMRNDDGVRCWGQNRGPGSLGTESTAQLTEPPVSPINLGSSFDAILLGGGREHQCALDISGQMKCWGNATYIGLETATNRGDSSDPGHEMGDNLPFVNLGSQFVVKSFTAGYYHTCALSQDHRIRCFGLNDHGQLGVGHKNTIGDDAGEMGDALVNVDLGTTP